MAQNLLAIIDRICDLQAAGDAYWERELPKRCPLFPFLRGEDDLGPAPPEQQQLRDFLKSLSPATVYMLLAIMYLGRGDYEARDGMLDVYQEMSDTFPTPAAAISQLMAKAPLARYLRDGVDELRAAGGDVDRLLEPASRRGM